MSKLYAVSFRKYGDIYFVVAKNEHSVLEFIKKEAKNSDKKDFLFNEEILEINLIANEDFSPTGAFQNVVSPLLFADLRKEK